MDTHGCVRSALRMVGRPRGSLRTERRATKQERRSLRAALCSPPRQPNAGLVSGRGGLATSEATRPQGGTRRTAVAVSRAERGVSPPKEPPASYLSGVSPRPCCSSVQTGTATKPTAEAKASSGTAVWPRAKRRGPKVEHGARRSTEAERNVA